MRGMVPPTDGSRGLYERHDLKRQKKKRIQLLDNIKKRDGRYE